MTRVVWNALDVVNTFGLHTRKCELEVTKFALKLEVEHLRNMLVITTKSYRVSLNCCNVF